VRSEGKALNIQWSTEYTELTEKLGRISELRVSVGEEALNGETVITENNVEQETMKPGEMQGNDSEAKKPR
jgi:hypothetical protein